MCGHLNVPVVLLAWTLYRREISVVAAWNFPVVYPRPESLNGQNSVLRQAMLWQYDGRSCLQPVTDIITWQKMVVRGREQSEMITDLER